MGPVLRVVAGLEEYELGSIDGWAPYELPRRGPGTAVVCKADTGGTGDATGGWLTGAG